MKRQSGQIELSREIGNEDRNPASMEEPINPYLGYMIRGYRLEELLGRGKVTSLYRARTEELRQTSEVVMTLIHVPEAFSSRAKNRILERFLHEAEWIVQLQHPSLFPLLGYGEQNGFPYLMMPVVSATTLATYLKRRKRWSPSEILTILKPVAAALTYIHSQGLVYQFFNPVNILLQNMFQVVYVHAADAPHEMMIYVQTTPDVNTVMAKIDQLDQKLYGGRHQVPIDVMVDATWPFAWYLRDYPHACFSTSTYQCPTTVNWPIIIAGGDNLPSVQAQYSKQYVYHQYEMRSQWDQGYMPPPCIGTLANPCEPQQYTGVGPLSWLSYGNNPPHPGQFNPGLIAKNVWQWWWHRKPFGDIDSGYGMALLIRKDLSVRSGVQP